MAINAHDNVHLTVKVIHVDTQTDGVHVQQVWRLTIVPSVIFAECVLFNLFSSAKQRYNFSLLIQITISYMFFNIQRRVKFIFVKCNIKCKFKYLQYKQNSFQMFEVSINVRYVCLFLLNCNKKKCMHHKLTPIYFLSFFYENNHLLLIVPWTFHCFQIGKN